MERELNRHEVEELIIRFLETCSLCVIATCSDSIPRASTVEFFPTGTTLYILTEGGQKIKNIKENPHISIAIRGEFTGWSNVKGLQITGSAEIGRRGSKIFEEGLLAYKRRRRSENSDLPSFMNVIKVKPAKMEYLDTTLSGKGYKVKHSIEFKG